MTEIENALNVLKKAFKDDQEYADGWHDNLAMMFFDGIGDDNTLTMNQSGTYANDGASRFMRLAFEVETKNPRDRNKNGS